MMEKNMMIVITDEDEILVRDYHDYKDMQKAVDGLIEPFSPNHFTSFKNHNGENVQLCYCCNEEFWFNSGQSANAMNYVINRYPQVIKGSIVIVAIDSETDDFRGFTKEEAEQLMKYFMELKNETVRFRKTFHAKYDSMELD